MRTPTLACLATVTSFSLIIACGDDDAGPMTPAADGGIGSSSSSSGSSGGNSDAGTDAGSDSGGVTKKSELASGDGFSIVYAESTVGVDARPSVKATFDEVGRMTSYEWNDDEKLAIGAATDPSAGGDALAAWGSWTGGPTTGKFYTTKPSGDFTFAGFHYAIGKLTAPSALPAGTVSYTLVGGSTPTVDGNTEPGKLDAATASCDFAAETCAFTIGASGGGGTYSETKSGNIVGNDTAKQARTTGGGNTIIAVFLGGAAERMGLIYYGGLSAGGAIRGSAVLKRTP